MASVPITLSDDKGHFSCSKSF